MIGGWYPGPLMKPEDIKDFETAVAEVKAGRLDEVPDGIKMPKGIKKPVQATEEQRQADIAACPKFMDTIPLIVEDKPEAGSPAAGVEPPVVVEEPPVVEEPVEIVVEEPVIVAEAADPIGR